MSKRTKKLSELETTNGKDDKKIVTRRWPTQPIKQGFGKIVKQVKKF